MGQPLEHALRSCVLAVRLSEALGLDKSTLREVYYQALLRYIGCNAETYLLASVFGDESAARTDYATVDAGKTAEVMRFVVRQVWAGHEGGPPLRMARRVTEGLLAGPRINEGFTGHCEVAQRLAQRLGFGEGSIRALGQLY